jgi:hypothetical protein
MVCLPREERGTRVPQPTCDGLVFEARGMKIPQVIEAGTSPETLQANGGRCGPHSKDPCIL